MSSAGSAATGHADPQLRCATPPAAPRRPTPSRGARRSRCPWPRSSRAAGHWPRAAQLPHPVQAGHRARTVLDHRQRTVINTPRRAGSRSRVSWDGWLGFGRGWVLTLLCPGVPALRWRHAQADPTRRSGNRGCPIRAFHCVTGGACQPEHDACRRHRGPRCRDRRPGASQALPPPSLTLSTPSRSRPDAV